MNISVLRNGNKVHHHLTSLWMNHFIHGSVAVSVHRSTNVRQQLQLSKSRFTARRTKEMDFSVPFHTVINTKTNGTTLIASITNGGFLLVGWYLNMIKIRPILTKSITSALIYTAADLTSQTMTRSSQEPYDLIRTCRMAGYGMIISGPSLHFWFNFVSRVFPKQDVITTFKKMFMGQAIYGPIITAVFFSVNAVLQGERGKEIMARLKRDMLPTMINNVLYWPVCDFITFRFIPVHLQPLVSNSFSYVWTIYITYMANLAKASNTR